MNTRRHLLTLVIVMITLGGPAFGQTPASH